MRRETTMTRCALLIAVLLVCPFARPAHAASSDAAPGFSLRGRVLDSMHAPIAGAHVSATAPGRPPVDAVTDHAGQFTLILVPDRYRVVVRADGFVDGALDLRATASDATSQEFVLQVAGIQEAVTVAAPFAPGTPVITTATKTPTPLRDVPQSVTVITQQVMHDQLMTSIGDVVRYVPGITAHQGENNRDQIIIRGNSSSADFFLNGVRDDVQYYRDVYNVERIEALKGPNAMIFGRGGGGGVVNRVSKEAGFRPIRELSLQGGMYGNKRLTADLDQPLGDRVAFRVNGMFESSDSFRNGVNLERYGVTPTVTIAASSATLITLRYERLHDARVADRGITSFQGRPADVDIKTFYGDISQSHLRADVNVATAAIEHHVGALTIRNQTLFGDYDRFYQNFVPGAVSADRRQVPLTSYNNATARKNLFNQTDLTYTAIAGRVRHTILAGVEVSRQLTDNFRQSGFFGNSAASIVVPFDAPTVSTPVTFRQNATDADNHIRASVAAVYGQDQIALSDHVQVVAGVRLDRFDMQYHNNRNGDTLSRPDTLVSPRAGLVIKPVAAVSLYGSYSVSYLPSSGDQFSQLTTITQQLEPEKFDNYEVGTKWDVARDLSLTFAVYQLNRTNTRSTDPNDISRIVQTGSQRTDGYELGINGHVTPLWSVAGGYAYQDAFVTSATTAARAGAQVGQVPRHSLSLWNSYQVHSRVGVGLGLLYRADMFAAIDNTVTLPGYTRVDGAAFVRLAKQLRLQANVENAFDRQYYVNADSNTNISPGYPRTLRIGLTTTF
jgi:catecholate siderophore receptor